MHSEKVSIESREGRHFGGYLAAPDRPKAPGIVLLQEIFGVNPVMRSFADRFAALGFIVLVPDLFWRQRPDVQLDPDKQDDVAAAIQLLNGLDETLAVEDASCAAEHLRRLPGCTGKVAVVGYCLGGKLGYLMTVRTEVDAAVSYYGSLIHTSLQEAAGIRKPLLLHIAENDFLCPPDAQKAIEAAMGKNPLVTMHLYRNVGHGFARKGKKDYNEAAAQEAEERTLAFLAQHGLVRSAG